MRLRLLDDAGAAMSRPMYAMPAYEMTAEDRAEEAEEAREECIADLLATYRADDDKRREAEEWTAGTFDDSHYTDVTLALHELHHTDPDRLLGSDLLTRLYRLAKVEALALDAQLRGMAEVEYDKGAAA